MRAIKIPIVPAIMSDGIIRAYGKGFEVALHALVKRVHKIIMTKKSIPCPIHSSFIFKSNVSDHRPPEPKANGGSMCRYVGGSFPFSFLSNPKVNRAYL